MINIFKKGGTSPTKVSAPKTTNELVQEIHETFYSEVDRLLAEASISNSLETTKQDLLDKCERLKKLGMTNTKEVVEVQNEIDRLETLKFENKKKEELIEAINYFATKYPQYKFITEDSVKKICEKYSLVYGEVRRYTGTVPNKNLSEIEKFKIKEEDICYFEEDGYHGWSGYRVMSFKYLSFKDYTIRKFPTPSKIDSYDDFIYPRMMGSMYSTSILEKCPLEIAAPVKDFNMSGMETKDFKISKIEIPDPVVLQPVFFKGKKHYLIVTAWGDEAQDELVVNQKMN